MRRRYFSPSDAVIQYFRSADQPLRISFFRMIWSITIPHSLLFAQRDRQQNASHSAVHKLDGFFTRHVFHIKFYHTERLVYTIDFPLAFFPETGRILFGQQLDRRTFLSSSLISTEPEWYTMSSIIAQQKPKHNLPAHSVYLTNFSAIIYEDVYKRQVQRHSFADAMLHRSANHRCTDYTDFPKRSCRN